MGGCCGGMKTGQKSLPDKKKSSSDVAALEKSNGKEAIPATDAGKTPTPDGQHQQESIAASAQEPVKGGGGAEPAVGSDNVMDLDTAVAPFEGVVSSADQPQIQANVAAADSDLLLPYQIPAQHTTLSCTTTTSTITTVRQEGVLLRVDEPLVDADFQGGSDPASSSSTGDVQVETVTKVTETVTTEAIPAVPEFGVTGESGEAVVEPAVVVVKSSSHEVQRLPEEILPSGELEGSGLTGEAGVGAEVSLPGFSVGFDHQLYPDPSQAVVSGSVSGGEQVVPLHAEFAIGEPSGFVRDLEQELIETTEIQQQVIADLEAAPESATESSSVPVQDIEVNASLGSPAQSAGEPLSTSSPFEVESSAPELHGHLEPEFSTSPQQPEDFPPPLQRDQAAEAPSFEGAADLSVTPSLPEELVKESEAGVAGSLQWEQDQVAEPAPYHKTEESQSRHQEFEQEQEPYQEQHRSEEPASYHAASGVESFEVQDPVSVSDDVIQSVETRPVIESVSEEVNESRNTWWKEGGQQEPEGGEVPVVETVSDQAQQSRQSWWEQSGSEPVLQREELPAESLPPQPDDLSSIPPPPPTSEEEEQAVITTPSIPAEIDAVSPSSDSFPEVIPEPLPSTFDQGGGAAVESPLSSSVDGSTLPTENGEVSGSSDEAFTPASVLSPEGSTPGASNLSPDGVEPAAAAASSKEPIPTQA